MAHYQRFNYRYPLVEKRNITTCLMKYEKWSLGYWCLKQYIIFADWLIHKKVIVTGRNRIPKNKPIVFAPNHQNALSDPMAVLLYTRFQPVWLARADIFKSKTAKRILRSLKIMPVYRLRDGKENLGRNEETFSDSIKVLENNFALALFPEAEHSGKRQLLPHKKAVPRIVFMAEEKVDFKLDIQIIPTGIYYSHYWKFNRTVIVNFGDPIAVKDYFLAYKKNPNHAIIALKSKIYESTLPLVINIRSTKHYNDFEKIREIYGEHFLKRQGKLCSELNRFESDQQLANRLDELEIEKPEETEKIVSMVQSYDRKIKKLKLRSWIIEQRHNNLLKFAVHILMIIAGLPVFIYGFIFNAIPFFTVDRLIRWKVKDRTFWSTFFLISGIILFPVIYVLELLAVSWLLTGFLLKLIFLISLPFTGKLAFKWYISGRKTIARFRLLWLKYFNTDDYRNIVREKDDLFQQLDEFIAVPSKN